MITEQDVMDCKKGLNNLTCVQIFSDVEHIRFDNNTLDRVIECHDWCKVNLGKVGDKWAKDGVTVWSYRIIFADALDAVAFRLKFGI
jgi:hypothetical protein